MNSPFFCRFLQVFCVAGTNPTSYLGCVANTNADLTSMYVRGDDMQDFPARQLAESIMTIKFLPYSEGVSSTKLRKEQYNASSFGPHVNADVHSMFYWLRQELWTSLISKV